MIEISFLAGALILTAIWIVVRILISYKKGKVDRNREIVLLFMYFSLVPLVNFFTLDTQNIFYIRILNHIAFYIPMGFIFPLIHKKLASFPKVVATGAAISIVIEILQIFIAGRYSNINDVALSMAGCSVGYCLYALLQKERAARYRKLTGKYVRNTVRNYNLKPDNQV